MMTRLPLVIKFDVNTVNINQVHVVVDSVYIICKDTACDPVHSVRNNHWSCVILDGESQVQTFV